MYIGVYRHHMDPHLIVERMSKHAANERFRDIHTACKSDHMQYQVIVPNHVQLICDLHECRKAWDTYGIPCIAVSMQTEKPEVPRDWNRRP